MENCPFFKQSSEKIVLQIFVTHEEKKKGIHSLIRIFSKMKRKKGRQTEKMKEIMGKEQRKK